MEESNYRTTNPQNFPLFKSSYPYFSLESSEVNSHYFQPNGETVTSFLIPAKIFRYIRSSMQGAFSARIRNLLEESAHLIYYGLISRNRKRITRSYQVVGQELQKISCRVTDKNLAEMDIAANALGISRSKLLVLMLEWEELGWLELVRGLGLVRGTTYFRRLESRQTFNRTNHTLEIEITQYRDS
ncbi:DUF1564 family protein [Leptospira idonii]|uniref:DUF1564 family protein n=1 Tax=Leptospira idonii TaxID=1193500 RepID=A0A4R9M5X6_9LEPT|nr:DUF1564 family protein [Leptospira idonii]TGN21087.1 DUF1564 family protein [Leptospira idonii]